jgi:UDP-N-acetylmuramate dehydrogenase
LQVEYDVPLAPHTTFELGGHARAFVEIRDEAELAAAATWARQQGLPIFVLGGGSNVVVSDRGYDGLVVKISSHGIAVDRDGTVEVAAGEPWDPFVGRMVEAGLAGIECLAGIPGSVGATPVQNVGAYGQEVSGTIRWVRTFDLERGEVRVRTGEECGFGYRTSIFKRGSAQGEVVTAVAFALTPGGAPAIRYAELAHALEGGPLDLPTVRRAVLALRRAKSMVLDPTDPNRRSAGSFFVNPIVPRARAEEACHRAIAAGVVATVDAIPRWPAGADVKLSAGWLIERAGFPKGTRRGAVGLSSKHALALVHHGDGRTSDLLAFAREIAAAVEERFGIVLEREPVVLGDPGP